MCAAEYINQAFNGQRGFQDGDNCLTCGDEKAKKCCNIGQYCNQVCQKYHRFVHKAHCQKQKGIFQSSLYFLLYAMIHVKTSQNVNLVLDRE